MALASRREQGQITNNHMFLFFGPDHAHMFLFSGPDPRSLRSNGIRIAVMLVVSVVSGRH